VGSGAFSEFLLVKYLCIIIHGKLLYFLLYAKMVQTDRRIPVGLVIEESSTRED
jgi:hypothetical protein